MDFFYKRAYEILGVFLTIHRLKVIKMMIILFRLPVPTDDSWGLGCTIWEVFNGPLGAANELGR